MKRMISAVCVALVVCYAAGLACMIWGNAGSGVSLWAISTVGGLAVLYRERKKREERKTSEESEQNERED